jgi:hypothetical protein
MLCRCRCCRFPLCCCIALLPPPCRPLRFCYCVAAAACAAVLVVVAAAVLPLALSLPQRRPLCCCCCVLPPPLVLFMLCSQLHDLYILWSWEEPMALVPLEEQTIHAGYQSRVYPGMLSAA